MHRYSLKSNNKFVAAVIFASIFFALLGDRFAILLQYDRTAILDGELWRVVTCHITHMGWNHLFLNLVGTMLLFSIFGRLYSPFHWLIGLVSCMVAISFSLLLFDPGLESYRGFSGVLYGLFFMGITGEIKRGNKIYFIGLLALIGKLISEQIFGPSAYTTQCINAPVIISVHLYGAITGGMCAWFLLHLKSTLPSQLFKLTERVFGPPAV